MPAWGIGHELIHRFAEEERKDEKFDSEEGSGTFNALATLFTLESTSTRRSHAVRRKIRQLTSHLTHEVGLLEARQKRETASTVRTTRQLEIDGVKGMITDLEYIAEIKNNPELIEMWRSWLYRMDR